MNIILAVSGGIAAYKAADLTSQAIKAGHTVRVVMTPAACQFIGPITFEALTNHKVMVDLWALGKSGDEISAVEHISWAKWADVVVYAPLTASTLGKLAHGIADNALTTLSLSRATKCAAAPLPRDEYRDVGTSRGPEKFGPTRVLQSLHRGRACLKTTRMR